MSGKIRSLALLLVLVGGPVLAGGPDEGVRLLDRQLDNIESRTHDRPGHRSRISDLQTRQDRRIAEQQIRALKTRMPKNVNVPLLERQLDRIRRPAKLLDR